MIIRAMDGRIHEVTGVFIAEKQDGSFALCGRVAWVAPAQNSWGKWIGSAADLYSAELPQTYDESVGGGAAVCLSDGYKSRDDAMVAIDHMEAQLVKAPICSFYDARAYKDGAAARAKHAEDMRDMARRMERINRR